MTDRLGSPPAALRFRDVDVDVRAGTLHRNGQRITLSDQPLHVLTALLERPGELVTRDELRRRLWPADTYVDFEHGLNAAVKRLRDALGDPAEAPVFIETCTPARLSLSGSCRANERGWCLAVGGPRGCTGGFARPRGRHPNSDSRAWPKSDDRCRRRTCWTPRRYRYLAGLDAVAAASTYHSASAGRCTAAEPADVRSRPSNRSHLVPGWSLDRGRV
jgi:hypothetical protein